MESLTITVRPRPGKPGWFEARAVSTLRCASGSLTVVSNSEISALRRAVDAVSEKISDPYSDMLADTSFGGHA